MDGEKKQNQAKAKDGIKKERIVEHEASGSKQNQAKANGGAKNEDIKDRQNQAKARGGDKKEGIGDTVLKDGEKQHNQAKTNVGGKNEVLGAKNPKGKDIQVKWDIKAKTGSEEQNQVKAKSGDFQFYEDRIKKFD